MAIAKASFRSILRSPSAVVFTIAFPSIFILVFGFLSGGPVKVKLFIDKDSDTNNAVFQSLQKVNVVKLVDGSPEKMHQELQKGEIDAILKIEKNSNSIHTDYTAHLITSTASPDKGSLAHNMLDNIISKVNFQMAHIQHPMAELKQEVIPGREYKQIDFILPGQLGFALLSTGVFGTAFVFFSLRQTLVIKRFFATPVKRISIIFGETISRMVFSLLGACFIITIGKYAFGFTLIHGWITFLNMLLLCAFGLIVFMGFGFIVSGLAKNESVIPPFANLITLPQFLLAGTFFSIDSFPSWLQPICKILPLTHLNNAMRNIAFEGSHLWDCELEIGILLLWGIVAYTIAIKTFKWE